MDHAPLVKLNIADNRLDQAGYVRRWYPSTEELWGQIDSTGVFAWPGLKLLTLDPVYDPAAVEATLASWTCAGTGATFSSVAGAMGSSGPTLMQSTPTASAMTITSDFTPEDNQPFYVDFWFHETFDKTWYASLRFSRNWGCYLLYNGTLQVWNNTAAPGETEAWQYVKSFKVLDGVTNKHLRLAVYPTAHQELILWPYGADPVVVRDANPVVTTDEAGTVYRTITQAAPVVMQVTSGSFYFSYRYMRFATTGEMRFPALTLPWEYTGAFSLGGQAGSNRAGYTPTVTGALYDLEGAEVATPATALTEFRVGIEMTSDDALFTPELNWAQLVIEPTYLNNPGDPLTITEHGRLTGVSVGAELRGRREGRLSFANIDGAYAALWSRLRMCASIHDADTNGLLWLGYLQKTDDQQGQDGSISLDFEGTDTLLRLEVPLPDCYIGDGELHTDFVEALFKRCGLAPTDYDIAVDPQAMILPEALGQDEPLFQARDGKTVKEMVEYICKVWSGWELYAGADGIIHYAPLATDAAPAVSLLAYHTEEVGYLTYLNARFSRDETNFFNFITVIGQDNSGRPLLAVHYDAGSVSDPNDRNYLGMEKLLVVVDSNLRTIEHVEAALGFVVADCGTPLEEADVETEWHDTLDVGDVVTVAGYGEVVGEPPALSLYTWQVQSLERLWEPDARLKLRLRKVGGGV